MALPYLEARLGSYCSYCGMKLDNAPEVEHVASKSTDPALITNWDNLLLACKACNPRKSNTRNIDQQKRISLAGSRQYSIGVLLSAGSTAG